MTKSNEKPFKHVFTIVNNMIDVAVDELKEEGGSITCRAGCNHCCHLLLEVCWEEAMELAVWITNQPEPRKVKFLENVKVAAASTREFFLSDPAYSKYADGWSYQDELPDKAYDDYFYNKKRACPILDEGICAAYEDRPSNCRLHLVTSDPALCMNDVKEHEDYDVPDEIEEVQEELAPVMKAMAKDGRWGQISVLTFQALNEINAYSDNSATLPVEAA